MNLSISGDTENDTLTFGEHFLCSSDPTNESLALRRTEGSITSGVSYSSAFEMEGGPVRGTKPRRTSQPVLSLLTENWEMINVSVHELTPSIQKTNLISGNGFLFVGRGSPNLIRKRIDDLENPKVSAWILILHNLFKL
jgi:hypothetical protein